MSTSPRISVVLPVRNGAAFLGEALDSLLRQTFTDFEVLAIDDGSQDDTPSILAGHAAIDPRIIPLNNRGVGLVSALNLGIEHARGDLIARMDADDRSRPDRLAAQIAYLDENPDVVALGTQTESFSGVDRLVARSALPCSPAEVRETMPRTCCLAHPTVVMRRGPVIAAGGYRASFRHAEDYDLWLRLLERAEIANLDMVGLDYRLHEAMSTVRRAEQQEFEAVVARHLARCRAKGGQEPDIGSVAIGRETLRHLGFDERTITRHVRKAWFAAARLVHRAGDPVGRRRCLASVGPLRMPGGGIADYADYVWRWLKVFV